MSSRSEFTYISTFAGCGGSSLGYKWAGGQGLAAVEFDANAAETYRLNFPETPVIERDIAKVTAKELMEVAGISAGQLDILDGSPPCQGFSTAGKRQIHDPRNSLFSEFVRLIEGLQPKVFVMENVSGMVKGKMKIVFRQIMLALKATGYNVRCKLLNAMYFNVPQSRERLIWIGVRPDLGKAAEFPKAQGKPMTAGEALDGCPVGHGICQWPIAGTKLYEACNKLEQGQNGQDLFGKNYAFQLVRIHRGRPTQTIVKRGGLSGAIHPTEARKVSTGEAGVLGSFPVEFVFAGGWADAIDRIGNSVPPRFAQAIAETIRDRILPESSGPTEE